MLNAVNGDKKIKNLIVGAIRRIWSRHPTKISVLKRVRVERVKYNKNGEASKSPAVFYTCDLCGKECKPARSADFDMIHIDHIEPVVPVTGNDLSWDQFISRLVVDTVDKLQALCATCHSAKTKVENAERRANTKLRD